MGMYFMIAALVEVLEEADPRIRDKLSARMLEISNSASDNPNISQAISYFELMIRR